jgi:hypothetical protein
MKASDSRKIQALALQDFAKGVDPCLYGFKVGHGKFHVNESGRNTRFFKTIHQLRTIKGIRFTEFKVPE